MLHTGGCQQIQTYTSWLVPIRQLPGAVDQSRSGSGSCTEEGRHSIFYILHLQQKWVVGSGGKVEFTRQRRTERGELSIRTRLNRQKQFRVGFSVIDFGCTVFCFRFLVGEWWEWCCGCLHTPYLKDQSVQTSHYRSVSRKLRTALHTPHGLLLKREVEYTVHRVHRVHTQGTVHKVHRVHSFTHQIDEDLAQPCRRPHYSANTKYLTTYRTFPPMSPHSKNYYTLPR